LSVGSPLTEETLGQHAATAPSRESTDEPSFREIFDEYAPFVWRTLRHLGIAEADLDDVCQDVFTTVHRKLDGFEGRSTLRTWVYGICLRVASDRRRRAHVRREQPMAEPPVRAVEATQDEDYARTQARALLTRLLEALDDDKRAVFVLYEIEGLPMKEIAEIVGCPLQTAYSRLHAARDRVQQGARRYGGDW
jgi:RNA polymerase sigma-70 factor, ECF subfamily